MTDIEKIYCLLALGDGTVITAGDLRKGTGRVGLTLGQGNGLEDLLEFLPALFARVLY